MSWEWSPAVENGKLVHSYETWKTVGRGCGFEKIESHKTQNWRHSSFQAPTHIPEDFRVEDDNATGAELLIELNGNNSNPYRQTQQNVSCWAGEI